MTVGWRRYALGVSAGLALICARAGDTRALRAPRPVRQIAADREPITPIPKPQAADPSKLALGESLFSDSRLSRDGSRACSTCHDTRTNGASRNGRDRGIDGSELRFNTSTIFNAALNYRFSWEGSFPTLEAQAGASLENPQIMGTTVDGVVRRLRADPRLAARFEIAYGRGPDRASLLDAIATYERSLLTPDSRFDRWLEGDTRALSPEEQDGYRLFKTLGCASCHQGVNVGGNLRERFGVFHRPTAAKPRLLRVPSLRNVAVTAPYFDDGSSPTLEDTVRTMGRAQLNQTLSDRQTASIVAFLKTLTGTYRGRAVRRPTP